MNNFSKLAVFSLVVLLFAPALKTRFEFGDLLVYYVPFAIFLVGVVVLNLVLRTFFFENLAATIIYLLLLSPLVFAFITGDAQQTSLLVTVIINCTIAAMVVVYPWNHRSVHLFFVLCAVVGSVLSVHTLLYFGTDVALEFADEAAKDGYLAVSLASGFACIACLYLVLSKPSLIYIAMLAVNWLGIATSRGRGALLVCVFVTIAYIIFALSSKRFALKKTNKYLLVTMVAVMVPLVIYQLTSIQQNIGRWTRLLTDFTLEVEVGGRGDLIRGAMSRISEAPVIGNGLGEYLEYGHPHNIFLQYGVDAGMIGMVLVFLFLLKVSIDGFRAISRHHSEETNLACVSLFFFLFMVANMMKSGDAYLGREFFIVSALPIVMFQLGRYFRMSGRQ